jgi:hypothetical protein
MAAVQTMVLRPIDVVTLSITFFPVDQIDYQFVKGLGSKSVWPPEPWVIYCKLQAVTESDCRTSRDNLHRKTIRFAILDLQVQVRCKE